MTDNNPDTPTKTFVKKNPWIIIPGILIMGSVLFFQLKDKWNENKKKQNGKKKTLKKWLTNVYSTQKIWRQNILN